MNFTLFLRDLDKKFGKINDPIFSISIEEQKNYLGNLTTPDDDYERSFLQYKCQRFMTSLPENLLWQAVALAVIPFYFAKFYYNGIRNRYKKINTRYDAIFVENGMNTDIIPDSLLSEYPLLKQVGFAEEMAINREDIKIWLTSIKRHPFSFYFHLKLLIKLGMYSSLIAQYAPRAIISYTETSFTTAILTHYCENKGISHINVMHGDFLYQLTFSFLRYTRFYVWHQHYVDMFISLRCCASQFYIELPKGITRLLSNVFPFEKPIYYITYYLSKETPHELSCISQTLRHFSKKSKLISIRPHPRFSNIKLVKKLFFFCNIEDPQELPLIQSLARTEYIASLYSTVLYQAYNIGKPIVIDDVSLPEKYIKLKDLKHIMLNLPHLVISKLMDRLQPSKY